MRYSLNRYAVHRVVLKITSSTMKRSGRGVEEGERMRNNVQWKFFTHAPIPRHSYRGGWKVRVGAQDNTGVHDFFTAGDRPVERDPRVTSCSPSLEEMNLV